MSSSCFKLRCFYNEHGPNLSVEVVSWSHEIPKALVCTSSLVALVVFIGLGNLASTHDLRRLGLHIRLLKRELSTYLPMTEWKRDMETSALSGVLQGPL